MLSQNEKKERGFIKLSNMFLMQAEFLSMMPIRRADLRDYACLRDICLSVQLDPANPGSFTNGFLCTDLQRARQQQNFYRINLGSDSHNLLALEGETPK